MYFEIKLGLYDLTFDIGVSFCVLVFAYHFRFQTCTKVSTQEWKLSRNVLDNKENTQLVITCSKSTIETPEQYL